MSQELPESFDSQSADVQQTEKMIPASKVGEIVSNARKEAADKAYRKALEESQMQMQQQSLNSQPQEQQMPDINHVVSQAVQEQLSALAQQHYKQQQEDRGKAIAQEFANKVANSSVYEDNQKEIEATPWGDAPVLLQIANAFDNTAEIAAELARNKMKFSSMQFASEKNPDFAMQMMKDLSESIKSNQAAKNIQLPGEPMSQIKSSPNAPDNGKKTLSDFRKMYR